VSTVKTNNAQIGQSVTATNNFTWYQPSSPDGTVRLGNGNAGSVTDLVTVNSSGNVGIGTSSPADSSARLTVSGTSTVFLDASGSLLRFNKTAGTDTGWLSNRSYSWFDGNGLALSTQTADPLRFGTNSAEKMRLDSSGNLLVGTTSSSARLTVSQSADAGTFFVENTNATVTANIVDVRASRNTTAGSFRALAYYNTGAGAYKFYVIDGGNLYSTSATVNVISDQRLKENVRDLDTGLKEILALRPRRFDWKEDQGDGSKDTPGFIAQEVEQVMPELVVPWNVTGSEADDHKGLATGNLIPTLVKAIQELSAELNELKQKVNA
jgi:hypothetical protein